jgi:hypothetical protein
MFGLCEYLMQQAQSLDSQGRYAIADIIDRLAQSTSENYPVLYHGTMEDYAPEDVQTDQNMQGLYMTTSKKGAGDYGDVRTYRLKPDVKILDLSDGEELWQWMIEQGILDEEDIEDVDLHSYVVGGQVYQYDLSSRTYYADDIVKTARYLGYDVVKMPDYPLGDDHTAWVATHKDAIQPERLSYRQASPTGSGEYWIGEDGNAIYADGDVGDYNHAMIAEQEILNRLGYDSYYDEPVASLDDAQNRFSRSLDSAKSWNPYDESDLGEYFEMLMEKYGEDDWKDYAELEEYLFWKANRHTTDEQELTNRKKEFDHHWSGMKDPTLHAVQHFGWHRVKPSGNIPGISVETWELTPATVETIARGLYDAYDEMAEVQRYNIDVRSTGDYLTNVPFSEIEDGTVVYRLKKQPSATPMQKSLDNVDLSNQMAQHAPVSDARYKSGLETAYPDNDKIKELYRYQGATDNTELIRHSSSAYSWYAPTAQI